MRKKSRVEGHWSTQTGFFALAIPGIIALI
jgi:hypothetical protein